MKEKLTYEKYDANTQYKLLATGCQIAMTALNGIPVGGYTDDSIYFLNTQIFITEKGKPKENIPLLIYEFKDLLKVKKLTARKSHYHLYTSITKVVEPRSYALNFDYTWYGAALIGQKKNGELRGYLLLTSKRSWVMGIWPIANRTLFERDDKSELQGFFKNEINKFTKPKLWSGVFMFNRSK